MIKLNYLPKFCTPTCLAYTEGKVNFSSINSRPRQNFHFYRPLHFNPVKLLSLMRLITFPMINLVENFQNPADNSLIYHSIFPIISLCSCYLCNSSPLVKSLILEEFFFFSFFFSDFFGDVLEVSLFILILVDFIYFHGFNYHLHAESSPINFSSSDILPSCMTYNQMSNRLFHR